MGIESPPVRVAVLDSDGKYTRAWREWLQKVTDAINNTETLDVVTQAVPELTTEITYIKGD